MRRYFINDPSPIPQRSCPWPWIPRGYTRLMTLISQIPKIFSELCVAGVGSDHPGLQGRRDGGGRVGQCGWHAGHPDEARPGEHWVSNVTATRDKHFSVTQAVSLFLIVSCTNCQPFQLFHHVTVSSQIRRISRAGSYLSHLHQWMSSSQSKCLSGCRADQEGGGPQPEAHRGKGGARGAQHGRLLPRHRGQGPRGDNWPIRGLYFHYWPITGHDRGGAQTVLETRDGPGPGLATYPQTLHNSRQNEGGVKIWSFWWLRLYHSMTRSDDVSLEYYSLTSHAAVCLIHWNVFNHVMICAACKDNLTNDGVWLSPSQVKTPKYNCPQGLYSDTTMDEMISGTSSIEWVHVSKMFAKNIWLFQYLKTIFIPSLLSSVRVSLILKVQPMPRW